MTSLLLLLALLIQGPPAADPAPVSVHCHRLDVCTTCVACDGQRASPTPARRGAELPPGAVNSRFQKGLEGDLTKSLEVESGQVDAVATFVKLQ